MKREMCILHANCQGEELEKLLMASRSFSSQYRLRMFTNYTKEPIPKGLLQKCTLFLYQYLEERWGDISSATLLTNLPTNATALCIPNHRFVGYWPMWTSQRILDFGDSLLNRLIAEQAPKPVILKIYLKADITKMVDIHGAIERSIQMEREREAKCCVQSVDFFLERWLDQAVFHTNHHPGLEVLVHTANGILYSLNMPSLTKNELAKATSAPFPSYNNIEAPIHPQVAKLLNLKFIKPGQKYTLLDRQLTFEEFVSRYIDFCLGDYGENLLAYLQLV